MKRLLSISCLLLLPLSNICYATTDKKNTSPTPFSTSQQLVSGVATYCVLSYSLTYLTRELLVWDYNYRLKTIQNFVVESKVKLENTLKQSFLGKYLFGDQEEVQAISNAQLQPIEYDRNTNFFNSLDKIKNFVYQGKRNCKQIVILEKRKKQIEYLDEMMIVAPLILPSLILEHL